MSFCRGMGVPPVILNNARESISNRGLRDLLLNLRLLFGLHSRIPTNKGLPELIIFARSVEVRPFLSQRLVEEECVRVRLTDQQAKVLAMLGKRRRVAICGGAGTGKTMLAFEKARRLAIEGFRTLLLCYNRPLADFLAALRGGETAPEVLDFHQLCSSYVQRAQAASQRNLFAEAATAYPRADKFDVQWPLALAYATEVLSDRFDAIVVDEGQDFREEYWLPIELLLSDGDKSPLYVFFDQNQSLYTRVSSFPVCGRSLIRPQYW